MANIGILDGDLLRRGKRGVYPNLALMKISAWHKHQGDNVGMVNELSHYDKVYCSKVFTFGKSPLKRDYAINKQIL